MRWLRLASAHPALTTFVVALTLRVGFVVFTSTDPMKGQDSVDFDIVARDLIEGRGFRDPHGYILPPLYPLFVAACYALGGVLLVQAVQLILSAWTAGLIGRSADLLYGGGRPDIALVSGLMAALYPWFFQFPGTLARETLFTFLLMATLVVLLSATRTRAIALTAATGLLFGLATLTRPNVLSAFPVAVTWFVWRTRRSALSAVLIAAFLVTLAPFAAFNIARGTGPVVATNAGGLVFFLGNNPDLARLYLEPMSDDAWRQLNSAIVISPLSLEYLRSEEMTDEEWRQLGRIVYGPRRTLDTFLECRSAECEPINMRDRERYFYAAALRYIWDRPVEWTQLMAMKTLHALKPWVEPRVYPLAVVVSSGVSFSLVVALAVIGLLRMPRASAFLVGALLAVALATMIAFLVLLRYRFALVDPLLLAAAGGPTRDLIAGCAARIRPAITFSGRPATATSTGSTSAKR